MPRGQPTALHSAWAGEGTRRRRRKLGLGEGSVRRARQGHCQLRAPCCPLSRLRPRPRHDRRHTRRQACSARWALGHRSCVDRPRSSTSAWWLGLGAVTSPAACPVSPMAGSEAPGLGVFLWAEWCPPDSYVDVLTLRTSEGDSSEIVFKERIKLEEVPRVGPQPMCLVSMQEKDIRTRLWRGKTP